MGGKKTKMKKEQTLADHAELWWKEKGEQIPDRNTSEWKEMYERWIGFAFEGFGE